MSALFQAVFGPLLALGIGALASVHCAQVARAQDRDVVAAAKAFEQAQRAELGGDPARAAEFYELADRIAPAAEALRNATRARLAAGQQALAATHAEELLRRYSGDTESRELAEEVLRRTRPELGRLSVKCSDPCTLLIDNLATGTAASTEHVAYVERGSHTLVARFEDGSTETAPVAAEAGQTQALQLVRPPQAPAAPPAVEAPVANEGASGQAAGEGPKAERRGLPPLYFWIATGATVAMGGVTLWSGLDLLNARDDFKSDDTPTRAEFDDGERKDLRTTILIASTATLAVGTGVLAFFTDFRGESATPSLSFDRHGGLLGMRGAF